MTGAAISGKRAANLIINHKEQEKPLGYRQFVASTPDSAANRRLN
jgi:hypothetical protein